MAQLNVHGKNMELTPRIQDYIEKKVRRLDRHLPSISTIEVEVTQEDTKSQVNRYIVQVTLNINGRILRGQERASTAFVAVDTVVDTVERRLERFKGKHYLSEQRPPPGLSKPAPAAATERAAPLFARVKRFVMKPMPPEEAVEQMDLLGHDFFMFHNSESNQFNVVYRRADGTYGLIEPEVK
ncbi:MAG: ribosome-associated translation inhibitor RaiA [Dehalococcoidia bacterium]|nr:ribosome-associated translation inhibitor RaiA [Dehalococcoidia bacterium]